MFKIREITPQDAEILAPVAHKIFLETFLPTNTAKSVMDYANVHLTPTALAQDIARPQTWTLGVFVEEQIVGYMLMLVNEQETYQDISLELKRFYLLAEYHGRGWAQEMMATCEKKAKELGFSAMWLGVWENNFRAQKFYQKCGFEKIASHPFIMGDEAQTDFIMAKRF